MRVEERRKKYTSLLLYAQNTSGGIVEGPESIYCLKKENWGGQRWEELFTEYSFAAFEVEICESIA